MKCEEKWCAIVVPKRLRSRGAFCVLFFSIFYPNRKGSEFLEEDRATQWRYLPRFLCLESSSFLHPHHSLPCLLQVLVQMLLFQWSFPSTHSILKYHFPSPYCLSLLHFSQIISSWVMLSSLYIYFVYYCLPTLISPGARTSKYKT